MLNKSFFFIFLLYLCLLPDFSYAARNFERYQLEQGLSQNTVNAIVQDHYGFLWVGTQDGLNRFDGYQFKHFQERQHGEHSLEDDYIISLMVDSKKVLWIGTRSGGLHRFDEKQQHFTQYLPPEHLKVSGDERITSIIELDETYLLLGTFAGLRLFNRDTGAFQMVHTRYDASKLKVSSLLIDRKKQIWVGSKDYGVIRFNDQALAQAHYYIKGDHSRLSSNMIWSLFEDGDGVVWIGTEHGANAYQALLNQFKTISSTTEQSSTISSDIVRSFAEDNQGTLWIATDNGLNYRKKTHTEFTKIYHNPTNQKSLSGNSINHLYISDNNILWLGLFSKGLNKHAIGAERFAHYKHDPSSLNSLSANNVWSFAMANEGKIWVGTDGGGLNLFNPKDQSFEHFKHQADNPHSLQDNRVWSLLQNNDENELWIGSYTKGVSRKDLLTNQFTHYAFDENNQNTINGNTVVKIYKDRDQKIWVCTNNGLSKYDRQKDEFIRYQFQGENSASLNNAFFLNAMQDNEGTLWLSTYSHGAIALNLMDNTYRHFKHSKKNKNSLSGDKVTHIFESRSGEMWISTYGSGISIYNPVTEQFRFLSKDDGLANNSVYVVIEDETGTMWITTNSGISRYQPEQNKFVNYGVSSGIQSTEFNTGAYLVTPERHILFGGVNGFNYFSPQDVNRKESALKPIISDFKIFNQAVEISDSPGEQYRLPQAIHTLKKLVLDYKQLLVSFDFSSLNFAYEDEVEFQYQLQGFDQSWINVSHKERRATYTNLPSGDYTLLIRAKLSSADWSDQVTQLKMSVTPAPWLTWYAFTLYAFVTGFILWRLINQRVQKFKKLARSEQRLGLALWGSQNELWDWDVNAKTLYRSGLESKQQVLNLKESFDLAVLQKSVHKDDYHHLIESYQDHISNKTQYLDVRYRKKDAKGQWRWFRNRAKAVIRDEMDKAVRIVGTVEDVNAFVEAEMALKALNEELEQRVATRTSELNRTLHDLQTTQNKLIESEKMSSMIGVVSGVAHELNTPLGIVLTSFSQHNESIEQLVERLYAQTLTQKQLSQFESHNAQSRELIERGINKAIRLVQNFKALSVHDKKEAITRCNLLEIFNEVKEVFNTRLRNTNTQLIINSELSLSLKSYRISLIEIFTQLIENSLTHAFEQQAQPMIIVSAIEQTEVVEIHYHDNGCGLSQTSLEKLCEPFYTTKRGTDCTGLGMSIVYNHINYILGGELTLNETQPEGLYLIIKIPKA